MKIYFLILMYLLSIINYSQEKMSYYSKDRKIEFNVSSEEYFSKYSDENIKKVKVDQNRKISSNAVILKKAITGDFSSNRLALKSYYKDIRAEKVEPILIYRDGTQQIVDGQINIKIKPNVDIHKIVAQWNFSKKQNEFDPTIYQLISLTYSTETIFNIVNKLQSQKEVEFAEPNFIRLISTNTADPYFSTQWALKNAQGANIKIEETWRISTGEGIKVAVLDEGVDLNHPDLKVSLLAGYDATANNSRGAPNYQNNDAHGTSCAGIITAVANNNIGVVGIAHNAKMLPVRIAYSNGYLLGDRNRRWVADDSWIANGINWAWQNGADVLSNSWGGGSYSMVISESINNALTKGRNGKGCIVAFSSGNNNGSVNYPANSNPNILTVGAMSPCNERKSPSSCDTEKWGSNYGQELDVMAPGVLISTTDLQGSQGYNSNYFIHRNSGGTKLSSDFSDKDYTNSFNGTSSACPHVAGVAALILSANPNLTGKEVRDIIEKTAQKVGGYNYQNRGDKPNGTWNNEMGYGLVDAYKAVQYATIGGVDKSCVGVHNTFELKAPIPAGATIKWSANGMRIISGQGTQKCVISASTIGKNNLIKVTVTHNGNVKTYEKEIEIQNKYSTDKPTLANHPNSPSSIPCCGGSNYINHVICTSYTNNLEWENKIIYKDPKDSFTFINGRKEVNIQATRFTATPFIVSTRAREVASSSNPCSDASDWSGAITRYYGATHSTSSFRKSLNNINANMTATNDKIFFSEHFLYKGESLRIVKNDIYQWLDQKYGGRDLNEKEVDKIISILNNTDSYNNLNVKFFNIEGRKLFEQNFDTNNEMIIDTSQLTKGMYVIYYICGDLSYGKVIYKP